MAQSVNRSESDVSAVVLTIGEGTTAEAIRAVQAQTSPVREIVVVENVIPFHRALNQGASRVRTPFFVQVDADMILDPTCVETLRGLFTQSVVLVSGFLRDRLLGRTCCIKMFRTEAFTQHSLPDTIAPDVDFVAQLTGRGWLALRALRFDCEREEWHTFGEHRRHYSPHYTFHKFLLEGCRTRYRKDALGIRSRLELLHRHARDVTLVAQIGLGHGIFVEEETDLLRPQTESDEWRWLDSFLRNDSEATDLRLSTLRHSGEPKEVFRGAYRCGIRLRAARDVPALRAELNALGASNEPLAWVAHAGLCHGLFATRYDDEIFETLFRMLEGLLD